MSLLILSTSIDIGDIISFGDVIKCEIDNSELLKLQEILEWIV